MNEAEARLIEDNMVSFANCCLLSKAEGYLEGLEQGRKEERGKVERLIDILTDSRRALSAVYWEDGSIIFKKIDLVLKEMEESK